MGLYYESEAYKIVEQLIGEILCSGWYTGEQRSASMIKLFTIIETIMDADGETEVMNLLSEAKTIAYSRTQHHHESAESYFGDVSREVQRTIIKATETE